MGKHSRCVIDICDNDMQNPELHKKHSNVGGDIIMHKLSTSGAVNTAVWNFTLVNFTEVKFTRSEFHFAWTHVNANNEVTLHQSEILPQGETSDRFEFASGLM